MHLKAFIYAYMAYIGKLPDNSYKQSIHLMSYKI